MQFVISYPSFIVQHERGLIATLEEGIAHLAHWTSTPEHLPRNMPSDLSYWIISSPLKDGDPNVMLEQVRRSLGTDAVVGGFEVPEFKVGSRALLSRATLSFFHPLDRALCRVSRSPSTSHQRVFPYPIDLALPTRQGTNDTGRYTIIPLDTIRPTPQDRFHIHRHSLQTPRHAAFARR